MTNTKHTAGPWYSVSRDYHADIFDSTHKRIAIVDDINAVNLNPIHNAEFIVRACNSHYELLEALETYVNDWDKRVKPGTPDSPRQKAARAAIAKARGQS